MEVLDLSFKKTLKASKVSSHSEEMENSWPNYYDCQLKINAEEKFRSKQHFKCNVRQDMCH